MEPSVVPIIDIIKIGRCHGTENAISNTADLPYFFFRAETMNVSLVSQNHSAVAVRNQTRDSF
jgi:hypothetical protein